MKNLFRKPSTEKAIASISRALDELDAVVAAENGQIDTLNAEIEAKAKARLDAFTRRDRAAGIAKRFADLIA